MKTLYLCKASNELGYFISTSTASPTNGSYTIEGAFKEFFAYNRFMSTKIKNDKVYNTWGEIGSVITELSPFVKNYASFKLEYPELCI